MSFFIPFLLVCACLLIWSESLVGSILGVWFSYPFSHRIFWLEHLIFLFEALVDRNIVITILYSCFWYMFFLLKEVPSIFPVILAWSGTLSHLAATVRSCLVLGVSFGCCRVSPVPWSSPFPVVYPNPLCLYYLSGMLKHINLHLLGCGTN